MRLTRIIIDGVALVAAALIVPDIELAWGSEPVQTLLTVAVLAVVLGVIDTWVRPVLSALSLPINLLTMGLFSFLLNAGLLLLLAYVVDALWQPLLRFGDFPPDLTPAAIGAAFLASLVVSVVSTLMSVLVRDA